VNDVTGQQSHELFKPSTFSGGLARLGSYSPLLDLSSVAMDMCQTESGVRKPDASYQGGLLMGDMSRALLFASQQQLQPPAGMFQRLLALMSSNAQRKAAAETAKAAETSVLLADFNNTEDKRNNSSSPTEYATVCHSTFSRSLSSSSSSSSSYTTKMTTNYATLTTKLDTGVTDEDSPLLTADVRDDDDDVNVKRDPVDLTTPNVVTGKRHHGGEQHPRQTVSIKRLYNS